MPNASDVAANAFEGTQINQTVTCPAACPDDCDENGVCNYLPLCPPECPGDCDMNGVCNLHVVCPAECPDDCDDQGNCKQQTVECPEQCLNDCNSDGVCNLHPVCPEQCLDDCDEDGVCNEHPVVCPSECLDDCDENGICNLHPVCPEDCPDDCDDEGNCPVVNDCAADEAMLLDKCVKVGDIVKFGQYRQSESSDTPEDLEWIVLDIEDDAVMVITKYVIDYKRYEPYYITSNALCPYALPYTPTSPDCQPNWRDSLIRSWLNALGADSNKDEVDFGSDGFIMTAFTDAEREKIKTVTINNGFAIETLVGIDDEQHPEWTAINIQTEDKVFLLSTSPYGSSEPSSHSYNIGSYTLPGDADLIHAYSTPYAYSLVGSNYIYTGSGLPEENILERIVDVSHCIGDSHYCLMAWWLRDIVDLEKAGVVDLTGNYFDYPFPAIDVNWNAGVRPALWIKRQH